MRGFVCSCGHKGAVLLLEYMLICKQICVYARIGAYMRAKYPSMRACMRKCEHVGVSAGIYAYMRANMRMCTHIYVNACIHAYMRGIHAVYDTLADTKYI